MQRFLGTKWLQARPGNTRLPLLFKGSPYRNFATTEQEVEDFGNYSIILPEEPFVFGTEHISQRIVPSHIPRPAYANRPGGAVSTQTPTKDSGKIRLGSEEEVGLRAAAKLARQVREFASSLAKVSLLDDLIYPTKLFHRLVSRRTPLMKLFTSS